MSGLQGEWERPGLAGGGLVLSAAGGSRWQPIRGMCIYVPALFVVRRDSWEGETERKHPDRTDTGGALFIVYCWILSLRTVFIIVCLLSLLFHNLNKRFSRGGT